MYVKRFLSLVCLGALNIYFLLKWDSDKIGDGSGVDIGNEDVTSCKYSMEKDTEEELRKLHVAEILADERDSLWWKKVCLLIVVVLVVAAVVVIRRRRRQMEDEEKATEWKFTIEKADIRKEYKRIIADMKEEEKKQREKLAAKEAEVKELEMQLVVEKEFKQIMRLRERERLKETEKRINEKKPDLPVVMTGSRGRTLQIKKQKSRRKAKKKTPILSRTLHWIKKKIKF